MSKNEKENGIITLNRNSEVANRNRFMDSKRATIHTRTSFDNNMPNNIGLSVFIEIEVNGVKKQVGKTKSIKAETLPKIRANLDLFGTNFTENVMENTNESSFKNLLETMFESVFEPETNEDE